MSKSIIFKEEGKTWYGPSREGFIIRQHDENFSGMKFEHKRCPFCNRITSIHALHWLNHLDKCAPDMYSNIDLLDLRYDSIEELRGIRVSRKK
jgi:hypothetical protein